MASTDDTASFAALATELQSEPDESLTASTIVRRLAKLVPDADEVSLTVRVHGRHETLASTGELATEADRLQYELGEGPCVEVADDDAWLRSGDVGADPRWRRWGPRAGALGIGSILSVQLLDHRERRGALNHYSRTSDAFSDPDVIDLALVAAVHAANALQSARLATNLQTALSSRHAIGMAQGIVMERFGLDEIRSFALLRRISSTQELKLREVAHQIVETRTLPGAGTGDG